MLLKGRNASALLALSWLGAHCGEVAAQRITGDPAA